MRRSRHIRIFQICYRIFLLLLLAAVLCLAGLSLYLKQRPEELAGLLAGEFAARSGLACNVRSVGVTFFPKPMLALVDVDFRGDRFTLHSPYVTIWPRLRSLLRGEFVPGEISLFRAGCSVRLEKNPEHAPPARKDGDAPISLLMSALPHFMDGCALVLRHSYLRLDMPNRSIEAEGIDSRLLLDFHSPQGEVSLARASLTGPFPLALYNVRLSLREAFHSMRGNTEGPGGSLSLQGRVDVPGMLSGAIVELDAQEKAGQADIHVEMRVHGTMSARGADLPLQGRLAAKGRHDALQVESLELRLADDVFQLAGLFEQGGRGPVFSGRLEYGPFSLPRYFAFARALPSGIQHSLDHLRGHMDFRLDAQGFVAPDLRCAMPNGAIFAGSGGVSFARPEISLDVRSEFVNLDEEFPALVRRGVTPPVYRHEPLVGSSVSTGPVALPDIGYDIRIRAAQVLVASSRAHEFVLRCSPEANGPLFGFGVNGLFGGQVQGRLAVSGEDGAPLSYALKLDAQKLDLGSMKTFLPANSQIEGAVSGSADLRFEGNSLEAALSRLSGMFSLRLEEGFHVAAGGAGGRADRLPVPVCVLSGAFQSRGRQEDRLSYAGKWQAEIQDKDWRAGVQLDGTLSISSEGVFPLRLSQVPGTLRVRRTQAWKGVMPQGLDMECSGKFSLDSANASVAVEDLRARLFDCDLAGHMRGSYAREGFEGQGRIGVKGSSLRKTLAALGMDIHLNPLLLRAFSGAALVAVSPGRLALSELEGQLDGSRFSGSLSGQWAQRPAWQGKAQVDALDLQAYLGSGPRPKKAKAWHLKFLQDFDAKGTVEVQRLRFAGMDFLQARSPVQLNGGTLDFPSITAELYGGAVTARFRLTAGEMPGIQAFAQASGVDLRSLSNERGMDAAYEGKASVQLELAGFARSGADIPAALNGRFSFEAGSGSMQARKNLKREGASPTRFDRIVISGPVERGVFRSERFQLDGPTLRATGGGWLSMPEHTLDVRLDVRMAGLPAFPVHIHGTIDKPQTSVQAGQALARAMGNLGHGVVGGIETVGSGLLDVLGGVLSVPFKLLK